MKVDVSVCIPTFNSAKTLHVCLDSVFRQSVQPKEVLVCDDNSTDETLSILKEYPVKLVKKQGKGVGASRNALLSNAKGTYLALLDPDTALPKNWLELRMNLHNSFPYIDCLSGGLQTVTLDEATKLSKTFISNSNPPETTTLFRQDGATIKKKAIEEVGGYDSFFDWGEDWDLKVRLLKNRKHFYFAPNIVAYHIRPKPKKLSKLMTYDFANWRKYFRDTIRLGNFMLFLAKYGSWYITAYSRHFISFLLRLSLLYSLFFPNIYVTSSLVILNLLACKLHHGKLKVGFLLDQLLKAIGEHRSCVRLLLKK